MKYVRPYLMTSSGEFILFKYIESIDYGFGSGSDPVVNRLRDDLVFRIITVSGNSYQISINFHLRLLYEGDDLATKEDLMTAIIEQWLYLNK